MRHAFRACEKHDESLPHRPSQPIRIPPRIHLPHNLQCFQIHYCYESILCVSHIHALSIRLNQDSAPAAVPNPKPLHFLLRYNVKHNQLRPC